MNFISKRLIYIFSLSIAFSVLPSITNLNPSNANPYDNLGLYRDYKKVENIGLSCEQLLQKGRESVSDYKYWHKLYLAAAANSYNERLYDANQEEALRSGQVYMDEFKRRKCDG